MSKNLGIAYAMKKRNGMKKMASSDSDNEKLHPMHEPISHKSVVQGVMDKMRMAMGGIVDGGDEASEAEDFLSDEADTPLADDHMPEDEEHEVEGMDPKKDILKRVMSGLHKRHMGK